MANAVTTAINALEKEELASLLRIEGEDRFHFFLFPALFLLLLATALGQRRGLQWGFWHAHPTRPESRGDETLFIDAPKALLPLRARCSCDTADSPRLEM